MVAIEPSTGAVKVMASVPGYDPNNVNEPEVLEQLNKDDTAPLFNRPTQGDLRAGLDDEGGDRRRGAGLGRVHARHRAERRRPGSRSTASRSPMPAARPSARSTWTSPLTHSVNTYFAQVGEKLGTETMFEYMDRFGFFKDPALDYPDDQMAPSGVYERGQAARRRATRSTSAASRSARSGS